MAPDPVQVVVDTYWLTLLTGVVLPMVVALVTKKVASGAVKSLTLLFLSIVAGVITQVIQNGGSFEVWTTVGNILLTFATGVIAHFGLLQPLKVTGKTGAIQTAVPGGIGSTASNPVQSDSV
jgi:hypothetical protein